MAVVLLLATPAIIIPGALNRFVFGKLLIAAIGAALAFTVPPRGRLTRMVRWLLAGAGALLLASALASNSPVASVFGRAPRYEGALVLTIYLLAGLSGVRLLGPARSPRAVQVALTTMAAVAVAVGVIAVLETFGLRPLSSSLARPGSLLGMASDEGALATLYAGPLLGWMFRQRRPLPVIGAGFAVVTVVLSASRGALAGLVVALAVLGLLALRRTRAAVAGTAVVAAALTLAVPFTRDRVLGTSPLAGHTISGRDLLWRETLRLVADHPLLGVGPSQFENAIVAEHDFAWESQVGPAFPPDSPHNWMLQLLDAGGPALLAVALCLGFLMIRAALGARRDTGGRDTGGRDTGGWPAATLAGLAGYATALLFHLSSPGTSIPALVLAGSLLAVAAPSSVATARGVTPARGRTNREPAPSGVSRFLAPAVTGLASLLAVVFASASVAEILLRQATVSVAHGALDRADSQFALARALRPWDVDLPAEAVGEFAVAANSGDATAIAFGQKWLRRSGSVADDEQVIEDDATLLEAAGQYRAALAVLTKQRGLDPDNPLLLLRCGVLQAELHDAAAAEADFRRAAVISPTSPEPWQDLATLYAQEGNTTQADQARAAAKRLQAGG